MRAFWTARGGNVAMMWGLMLTFLVGLAGLTVDFTRAQMLRAQLQNAADGAALAAARGDAQTEEQRQQAAWAFFESEMGALASTATFNIAEIGHGQMRVTVTMPMPMSLGRLVRDQDWDIHVESDAERSGVNLEVALVLDVTGSMSGQRIVDLRTASTNLVNTVVRDEQTPFYSKLAIVPYSMGVNMGGYADAARGPITGPTNISAIAWHDGTSSNISGVTRASPGVVTANNHGLSTGQRIYITGVNGMTQLNNKVYTVGTVVDSNSFRLRNAADTANVNTTSGNGYSSYSSGGAIRRCLAANCGVVITSNGHGLSSGEYVYFTGVNGTTQLNNNQFEVGAVNGNQFALTVTGAAWGAYTSGGSAYCTRPGCQYVSFMNASSPSARRLFGYGTCVSERIGAQRYTDAGPGTAYVGYNYASSANACPSAQFTPLSTDRTLLNNRISALSAAGSTAGQIGLAWGWYAVSPNWGHLWPSASQPASYNQPETLKIVVMMTDGAFNTTYCEGVIGRDSNNGAGNASERNTCNGTNGGGFDQAQQLCTAMKARGVVVYTVGLGLNGDATASDFLRTCATSENHAYLTGSGSELIAAFDAIAASISRLRIMR
ncbi:MAG TPA: ubiquitin-activating E1 FCCH domain-containing protein [Terricaulis sp.]|nr:ubiquitin-activating E1 FCCH domain-containing protein [Terricaulis sp.]